MKNRQLQVIGPKIVPPLRDAMCFVNGEQGNLGVRQQIKAARRRQTFGRDIQQIQLTAGKRTLGLLGLPRIECGIEERRANSQLCERRHLVLHQCDERRDHDGGAIAQ